MEDGDPGDFTVVNAKNINEAKFVYAKLVEIKKPDFLGYAYGELAYDAFMQDEEGRPIHLFYQSWRYGITDNQASSIFEQNVRKLFKNKTQYMKLYIDWWKSEPELVEEPSSAAFDLESCLKREARTHEQWQFPEEMLAMLAVTAWTEELKIVPLKKFEVN